MVFEEIYKIYWQKIFRLCMGYVNDYALAKDIAQDSFIIVLEQLPKFRNESNIGTWVFRIATNCCLRQIEKDKNNKKEELSKNILYEEQVDIEPQIEFLFKTIAELSEIDRIIISLELEDVNQSEIADIVGLSETNIRVRIHRIKEKLKRKFEDNGR